MIEVHVSFVKEKVLAHFTAERCQLIGRLFIDSSHDARKSRVLKAIGNSDWKKSGR